MKSKVLESGEGRQMRGFTATQLPKRGPQAKSGPQISSEGALVEISQEVSLGEKISMYGNICNSFTFARL